MHGETCGSAPRGYPECGCEAERAALPDRAVYPDSSTHHSYPASAYGQAQAAASVVPGCTGVRLREGFEDQ